MSGIATSIRLTDLMTGPLMNITNALNMTIRTFEHMQESCNSAFEGVDLRELHQEVDLANASLREMEENIQRNTSGQNAYNRSAREGQSAANGLLNTVKKMAATYLTIQGAAKAVDLTDQYTQTTARLNLMNDGLQTTEELQDKIYLAAERSRGLYTTMTDTVAKLGQRAKDAFASNDETIQFAENLNKLFAISGSSQQETASATLQLTQALGSGVLRGEELNAVFEAAPNVIQTIADYMDVPIGSIRTMAAEGRITAEIVKNAMLDATGKIDTEFQKIPRTFGQIGNALQNRVHGAFEPVFRQLSGIADSERLETMIDGLAGGLTLVAMLAFGVIDVMTAGAGVIMDNWSWIGPIIYGVAGALAVYYGWQAAVWTITKVSQGAHIALAAAAMLQAAATGNLTGTQAAAIAAQHGLNAAMYACPVTWIVIAIIGLIAIIFALVGAFNKLAGTSYSVTGAISGSFLWLGAFLLNLGIGTMNGLLQLAWSFVTPFIGIVEWILNVCDGGFDSFGAAVANLVGQIISWFLSLGSVVTKIIDAIFGSDWSGALSNLQNEVLSWGKNENAITISREAPSLADRGINRIDMTDAFDKGYSWGAGLEASITNKLTPEFPDIDDAYTKTGTGSVADYMASMADDTSAIADSVDISNENLKYLRDLAETEAINRFTTAEIKVEQTNYNTVNSGMDIDGMVTQFTDGMNEAIEQAAEGVHE